MLTAVITHETPRYHETLWAPESENMYYIAPILAISTTWASQFLLALWSQLRHLKKKRKIRLYLFANFSSFELVHWNNIHHDV